MIVILHSYSEGDDVLELRAVVLVMYCTSEFFVLHFSRTRDVIMVEGQTGNNGAIIMRLIIGIGQEMYCNPIRLEKFDRIQI